MELNGTQIKYLKQAILAVFPTPDYLRAKLVEIDRAFDQIVKPTPYQFQVLDVIQDARSQGWLPELIGSVREMNAADANLQLLEQSFGASAGAAPVPAEHHSACFLWGATPFADRTRLREALPELEQGNRVVLVVNGGPKTGKSHTYYLITYLAQMLKGYKPVLVDLPAWPATKREPEDVANTLLRRIGRPLLPPAPPTGRELNFLCEDLAAQVTGYGETIWAVIDGLSQVAVPDATKDMVQWLIERTDLGDIPNLRLILLGYTEPIVGAFRIVREDLGTLGADDLKTLLCQIARHRKLVASDQALTREAAVIAAGLTVHPEQGLGPLQDALEAALGRLPGQ
jgi:hypothetical protein